MVKVNLGKVKLVKSLVKMPNDHPESPP
jgi:hypothetical protein